MELGTPLPRLREELAAPPLVSGRFACLLGGSLGGGVEKPMGEADGPGVAFDVGRIFL